MREQKLIPKPIIMIVLLGLLGVIFMVSLLLGRFPVTPKEFFGIIFSDVFNIEPFWDPRAETVLYNIRLPRIFLAVLVGCCLATAGAAYQGVFQNPMASPDILGASNGAAFGAALAILLGASSAGIQVSAFLFSLLTVAIVFLVSEKAHGKGVVTLILAGIMVSSLFSAGTSYIKLVADPTNKLPQITYWLMGSLAGTNATSVRFVLIPMTLGMVPLVLIRWRLNVLTLGDAEARSLGVDAGKLRIVTVICSTLITAASVSVSGMIGWVGLVIPHLVRKLVGNDYKYLLPGSMLAGASFLLLVDDVSRNLLTVEIPIGILTAFIGAPFFLWLIVRRERV